MVQLLSLPHGLLVKILNLLSLSDKKASALVCTQLLKVARDPLLWTEVQLSRTHVVDHLANMMSCFRLSRLTVLDLANLKLNLVDKVTVAALLNFLRSNTNLRSVDLSNNDLSSLPSYPLATGLAGCKRVLLSQTRLNTEQLVAILGKCVVSRHVATLDLSFNEVRFVDAELLCRTVQKLQSLNLAYTGLSANQVARVTDSLATSHMAQIDLSGSDMADNKLDSVGLNQDLSELVLSEVRWSPASLDLVFTNLSLVHNLTTLSLATTVLTSVEPVLLSDAVVRVVRVDLNYCWLYTDHLEFILAGIGPDTKLSQLNLSGNHMESVSRDLLVEAVNHLDLLRVEWANMTEVQFQGLILETEEIKNKRVVLNHFELINNHLELHKKAKGNPNIFLTMDAK